MPSPSQASSSTSLSLSLCHPMDSRVVPLLLLVHVLCLFSPGEALFGGPPFDGPGFGRNFMPKNISCSDVVCGRGSCNASYSSYHNGSGSSYSYGYSYSFSANESLCGCRTGWGAAFGNGDYWYRPCVIPKCNTSSNCNYTLPSVPVTLPTNYSDPCAWAYCGAGKCVATSAYAHRCDCKDGFKNLFNDTTFPCYNECLIDNDECKSVGASLNATAESPGGSKGDRIAAVPTVVLGLMVMQMLVAWI